MHARLCVPRRSIWFRIESHGCCLSSLSCVSSVPSPFRVLVTRSSSPRSRCCRCNCCCASAGRRVAGQDHRDGSRGRLLRASGARGLERRGGKAGKAAVQGTKRAAAAHESREEEEGCGAVMDAALAVLLSVSLAAAAARPHCFLVSRVCLQCTSYASIIACRFNNNI